MNTIKSDQCEMEVVMSDLIMPKGTAVWLIENTALTFEQIARFCNLHILEVQALADDQISTGMIGVDPISMGQLTQDEIDRCTQNPNAHLVKSADKFPELKKRVSKKKYIPLLKRQERPDAIAWLIKFYPDMSDTVIASLISATKNTVASIREKAQSRMGEFNPRDPVLLGFCSQIELDTAIDAYKKAKNEK
ncbi:MAG: DUF1013 domain-containing protein [Alphaproteobacteria bacterium]|nr:DUF1013 domain-containing protein [Alphaproteobacteria bacterium]